ncbi:MAG: hypothetical protein INH41_31285 [Myxococcaceae bacterium]|jgi:hypothetical protein|nr:hypothetical protein [Myxococcaceae bacterium]MCA3016892.1 hypothetical protein [Myxococcaceae bacterium]
MCARGKLLISVVGLSACVAGPRALSRGELEAQVTRRLAAPFDLAFDAVWLSLEHAGLRVTKADRLAGTLVARRADGSGYDASVTSEPSAQRVLLLPVPERPLWQLDGEHGEVARLDAVERHAEALLAAWRAVPEWTVVAARDLVSVQGFGALLPEAWEKLEPSVTRRVLTVSRSRSQRRGLNPTLRFEVKRRAPREDHRAFLLATAGGALFAGARLDWPTDAALTFDGHQARGVALLGDDADARPVSYALWVGVTAALTVRVAAVCGAPSEPDAGCAAEWRALVASLTNEGLTPPP